MKLISQYEFAKRLGKSRQYVSKLVQLGKIPTVYGKIDPKAAAAALLANGVGQLRPDRVMRRAEQSDGIPQAPLHRLAAAIVERMYDKMPVDSMAVILADDEVYPLLVKATHGE